MRTAVCIASGPSLTRDDCELAATAGAWLIAVNNSWILAEWAHAVYAGDFGWWRDHLDEVPAHLERWTCSEAAAYRYKLHHHRIDGARGLYNSGQRAIELCLARGFARILLLGYDCSVAHGTHWHGDHASGKNPDASRCQQWRDQFAAIETGGAEVINCSRDTALTVFPRMTLEAALVL